MEDSRLPPMWKAHAVPAATITLSDSSAFCTTDCTCCWLPGAGSSRGLLPCTSKPPLLSGATLPATGENGDGERAVPPGDGGSGRPKASKAIALGKCPVPAVAGCAAVTGGNQLPEEPRRWRGSRRLPALGVEPLLGRPSPPAGCWAVLLGTHPRVHASSSLICLAVQAAHPPAPLTTPTGQQTRASAMPPRLTGQLGQAGGARGHGALAHDAHGPALALRPAAALVAPAAAHGAAPQRKGRRAEHPLQHGGPPLLGLLAHSSAVVGRSACLNAARLFCSCRRRLPCRPCCLHRLRQASKPAAASGRHVSSSCKHAPLRFVVRHSRHERW